MPVRPGQEAVPVRALFDLARGGDREAEAQLWACFQERARFFLARRTGDPHAVEDLAQDAFLAFREALTSGRLADPDRTAAYVLGICAHKAADWWAQRSRTAPLDAASEPVDPEDAEAGLIAAEDAGRVTAALRRLPHRDRTILSLHYSEGWDYRRIGNVLGMSEVGIRKRASRILERLRQQLSCLS